jgi:malonate transporter
MQVLLIVAPVFALIAFGFLAARSGLLSQQAHRGISEFAFGIAIPALLFRTIATAEGPGHASPTIWAAYFGATAITWLLATLAGAKLLRRPATDGAALAMSSVYGNIVMLGIPLALATFGEAAAAPMALILSINTPLYWLAGTLHIGWAGRQSDTPVARVIASLIIDLARNPIIIAIVAGGLWRLTPLVIPSAVEKTLQLLGQAGVPCALVALGASLVNFRIKGQAQTLAMLLLLKLLVMPAIAWTLAFWVLHLPPVAAGVVILFAAMPAGANAYLFATQYQRVVNSTSGAVALGTVLAAATVTALISILPGGVR